MKGRQISDRVVVGVDGSPEATAAARYAAAWAALRREPLLLVYAYQPDDPLPDGPEPDGDASVSRRRRAAETVVADVLSQLRLLPALDVEVRAEVGSAASVLAGLSCEASLVAVGQHRFSIDDQRLSGSVAPLLASVAPCPVVVVPRTWGQEAILSRRHPNEGALVVALDGETDARQALDLVFEQAELRQLPVVALHPNPDREGSQAETLTLAELVAGYQQEHPAVRLRTLLLAAQPGDAVVEASRDASMLVVGCPDRRHGPAASRRSVARSLIGRTHCPLVVVPSVSESGRRRTAASIRSRRG
ncbi:MAG: universal stress protein [Friedmanniella sp.]